jgi:hypothetical protein
LVPSGGIREALPIPLGSPTELGLAGPYGMPLIAELPAPADPAGGGNCADALADNIRLPSSKKRTNAEWPDIESPLALQPQPLCRELVPGLQPVRFFPV